MKSVSSAITGYLQLSVALIGAMAVCRTYEVASLAYYHSLEGLGFSYLFGTIVRDLQWCLIGALVIWPLFFLLQKFLPEKKITLTAVVITLMGMANLLLINYFSATLTPLGPEFWAYSMQEMSNTALASGRITLLSLLVLISAALAIFFLVRLILEADPEIPLKLNLRWTLPLACLFMLVPPSWFLQTGTVATNYQSNKLAYFISSGFISVIPAGTGDDYSTIDREYPFMHEASNTSNLAPFFEDFNEPPNIVFLIVESLGGEFVGSKGQWAGFAPNLDSLARSGLYWENGLSLSGRTFGMMPSLFGSLPPGQNGFMDLGPDYPDHLTLISLLGKQGYKTSFYSSFNTYFDKLDFFLQYQKIDFVLNKQSINENYQNSLTTESENYWGYDDKTMLRIASSVLDTTSAFPRLDIFHTLQSHSPFTVPDQEEYENKFNRLVNNMEVTESRKESFLQYRAELTTLLYADEAVGAFMDDYRKRPYFNNTIFVITGDHWLIPVPQTSRISRYHVPIIIYSPLLKEPVSFESVNTHANLTPALAGLLKQKTALSFPDSVHWIGSDMDTLRTFRNTHSLPLMKNKNQITDYLHYEFYLSDDNLFQLAEDLKLIEKENDEIKTQLEEKLQESKLRNRYAVNQNKLYPDTASGSLPDKYDFITKYDSLFDRLDEMGLNADQQFQQARELAFEEEYDKARAIAQRLLLEYPDFHDAKLLVGRTYSWQGSYEKAREIFRSVRDKDPGYSDTYNALFDVEYWDGNTEKALKVINEGLQHHPNQELFLEKKIRALAALNRKQEARKVYEMFQEYHPNSSQLHELKSLISD